MLSWLEFREVPGFRNERQRLVEWFDEFEARRSMRATPLSGDTHDYSLEVPARKSELA